MFLTALAAKDEDTHPGLDWLRTELPDYWSSRERVIGVLDYLAGLRVAEPMAHWSKDGHWAGLLAGAVRNDHV